jgi:hypothetical protein
LLENADLARFVKLIGKAEALDISASTRPIGDLLSCEEQGLTYSDFFCLCKSLKIAAVAGDIPITAANVADHIRQYARLDRYVDLSSSESWTDAIRVALDAIRTGDDTPYSSSIAGREDNVGNACRFVRRAGYALTIDAFGCQLVEQSRVEIMKRIKTLVGIVGGFECLNQIFRILREQERYHDGFWLFGDQLPSVMGFKTPTLPFAWLVRLALQNLSKKKPARNPDVAWKNLTDLATQFAACCNFERYSQWENFDVQPGDLDFLFARSAGWQQLFMLKQMPAEALNLITRALNERLDYADQQALCRNTDALLSELRNLVAGCPEDTLSIINRNDAMRAFPLIWEEAAKIGPFEEFTNPFDQTALSHENRLLFPVDDDKILILPRSLAAAAAATFLIEMIWKKLDSKNAKQVVGDVFERVVELACTGKAVSVFRDIHYQNGKTQLQIDVVTVCRNDVHFFEVKAKALTKSARSGDTITFLTDYADSYLSILKQLVRHETHFRAGVAMSPITIVSPKTSGVTKIAVSPLSFGPIGDRILANGIVSSLSRAKLAPIVPDKQNEKGLAKLSNMSREILSQIDKFAVRKSDAIDLHAYMLSVFWLDIGELIYILSRADSLTNALAPLKHVTFSSRDIWTEIANAERSKLTEKYWKPLATSGII